METNNSNSIGEDSTPEFSSKSDYSKPVLVMRHLSQLTDIRSKEMKKGFWNNKLDKNNNYVRVWIDDTRKPFFSAVDSLLNLLTPEILMNENMLKVVEEFEKSKQEIYERFCFRERIRKKRIVLTPVEFKDEGTEKWFNSLSKEEKQLFLMKSFTSEESYWEYTGRSFMPDIGAVLDDALKHSTKTISIAGLWDVYVDAYYDALIPLYDKLWRELQNMVDSPPINGYKSRGSF
jgi:hypothetical protein